MLNGILADSPGEKDIQLRFALDPAAEFFSVTAYGEECGPDSEKWEDINYKNECCSRLSGRD